MFALVRRAEILRRHLITTRCRQFSAHEEWLFKNYKDVHYCQFTGGDGGPGAMHFGRDCENAYMGPDGGNGGAGGAVWLRASPTVLNLIKMKSKYSGKPGGRGGTSNRDGANGQAVFVEVPVGTVVKNAQAGFESCTGGKIIVGESGRKIAVENLFVEKGPTKRAQKSWTNHFRTRTYRDRC